MNPICDLVSLVFPKICAICGNNLLYHETVICISCQFHLPLTNFHLDDKNPLILSFCGGSRIGTAGAYLYFNKGNQVQKLIHSLKYKNRPDIGVYLGKQYGSCLKKVPGLEKLDYIIPIPLHPLKQKFRGYNQSEAIAEGLSISMDVPVNINSIIRKKITETQTRKSRFRRWENVEETFFVHSPQVLINKHVLIVDDVITTGATIESCINSLQFVSGITISIAVIATAKY